MTLSIGCHGLAVIVSHISHCMNLYLYRNQIVCRIEQTLGMFCDHITLHMLT